MPAEKNKKTKPVVISDRLIETVCARLRGNKRVRRTLPGWGRVHIDRQLPFLCVYRLPPGDSDLVTQQLVKSEASYLIASGTGKLQQGLRSLVENIGRTMVAEFGAFLILELWASESDGTIKIDDETVISEGSKPSFRIIVPPGDEAGSFVHVLARSLENIKLISQSAEVEILRNSKWCTKLPSLIPANIAKQSHYSVLGLEIKPIYRNSSTGMSYPLVLREFRRGLTRALRRAFYEFARIHTTQYPKHFHTLGRKAVVKSVWKVDASIAEVADSFDFLLQVTPVNADESWREFSKHQFERCPRFHYRPLPVEPTILKRKLYNAPIERIEDPALTHLFREKQDELDRRITMLGDINTRRFVHGSLQLFGGVESSLENVAIKLLRQIPPRTRDDSKEGHLDAQAFAEQAHAEIEYYRQLQPSIRARVEIRDDIVIGSMVSRGSLLINRQTRVPAARVQALLQHEIGTHILTYYNGRSQPFRQLYSGLAGYEALQEGLAVLSEYLVGGLSRPRMRLLAARVHATNCMIDGASFVDTFRELVYEYGFVKRTAFIITMRIYRGGGLTKDALYLRGLVQLLNYLKEGGDLDILLLGKFSTEQVPIIRELLWRKVLHAALLRPRYIDDPDTQKRLKRACLGLTLMELVEYS